MYSTRKYQDDALKMLDDWFRTHRDHSEYPCMVIPTGGGKSLLIAEYCKRSLQKWPNSRFLILTHQKELIEQDVAKIRAQWPQAPIGIYSASVGKKELGYRITAAGIQSLARVKELPPFDCVIVDEAHLINNRETGSYRKVIDRLKALQPKMRVIGMTATPYRLGQGMVTDGIFADLIEPVSIARLQELGHLAMLTSKRPRKVYDLSGVGIRQGEYKAEELEARVNVYETNEAVCEEILERAKGRKHWLIFCTSIEHSNAIAKILGDRGIRVSAISSLNSKEEREAILSDFVSGRIQAVTNVGILTTGFDFPDIDCVVLLRPTMSPGLFYQMVGRGLRPKSDGGNCLVLDFAQNISTHGPITDIRPPRARKKGETKGAMPLKVCPECQEYLPIQTMVCPQCGHVFDRKEERQYVDDNMDIQGGPVEKLLAVRSWRWQAEISKRGIGMLSVFYFPRNLLDSSVKESFFLKNCKEYAKRKSMERLGPLLDILGIEYTEDLADLAGQLNRARSPRVIEYVVDRGFTRVTRSTYGET